MSSGRPGQAARREAAAMRSEMAWSKYSSSSSSCGRSTSAAASRNASSDSAGILPTSYSVTACCLSPAARLDIISEAASLESTSSAMRAPLLASRGDTSPPPSGAAMNSGADVAEAERGGKPPPAARACAPPASACPAAAAASGGAFFFANPRRHASEAAISTRSRGWSSSDASCRNARTSAKVVHDPASGTFGLTVEYSDSSESEVASERSLRNVADPSPDVTAAARVGLLETNISWNRAAREATDAATSCAASAAELR
mmetsp:Transcript_23116/g.76681  ORF Transcript_23116/g.76681 Transcript_23116/m.76681 type:complete len:260 (-) Transcript_23116:45-824(-)